MKIPKLCGVAALVAALSLPARAAVELPSVIGNDMVLQQNQNDAIWDWDAPGAKVTVSFRGQTVAATAGDDGKWRARVAGGASGGPFDLTIKGSISVTLTNVLVGEVWVAGGQSNMWWHVGNCGAKKARPFCLSNCTSGWRRRRRRSKKIRGPICATPNARRCSGPTPTKSPRWIFWTRTRASGRFIRPTNSSPRTAYFWRRWPTSTARKTRNGAAHFTDRPASTARASRFALTTGAFWKAPTAKKFAASRWPEATGSGTGASAQLAGETIVLSSAEVPQPIAARYDWANNPNGNLVNNVGLPAFAFRTDSWNLGLKSP